MNEFCAKKGIKREYSIARTPQQNGVAERKNRTLIEAARTISPNISFMRPFGCPLTILNTLDHLGKFDGKSEEGYLLGYSTNSKGFRVYNRVTRKVQDCLHVNFLENQENQKGKGPDWMFDLDLLTPSMNYIPVRKENYADSKEQGISCDDVEDLDDQQFIVHTAQPMHTEERTAAKEVPLSSAEQALHDELVSLMHQESLAKAHNDDQRIAFEEEKKRIALDKETRVRTKEQFDSLIDKLNLKSAENKDLKAQIQDKGIVKQAKAKQPLDNVLDFACSSKNAKIVESMNANNSEPNHNWGSNATDIPSSSSLVNDRSHCLSRVSGYDLVLDVMENPLESALPKLSGYSTNGTNPTRHYSFRKAIS
ncbi:ribonuclease H-like domain-containing protein [Tanacetum coccineum]